MTHELVQIHPTAIVEKGVSLGANVKIGAFSYIGAGVEIGDGTEVKTHVVIKGPTKIGSDNIIFQFASIGEECQDLKYAGEPTKLEIGNRNTIRESVTIHRGTIQDKGITRVGDDNLLMINVHIAHDCELGNGCVLANNATLAGHVRIGDNAIIGGMSAVHQFCTIGGYSMIGGGSIIVQDVPPFIIAQGNHCSPFGVNIEGLKRRGFDKSTIQVIRRVYKLLYRSGLSFDEVKKQIILMVDDEPQLHHFVNFFALSSRGIIR